MEAHEMSERGSADFVSFVPLDLIDDPEVSMIAETPPPAQRDSIRQCLGKMELELKKVAKMMKANHVAQDENSTQGGSVGWVGPHSHLPNGAKIRDMDTGDDLARKWRGQVQMFSGEGASDDAVTRRFQGLLQTVLQSAEKT